MQMKPVSQRKRGIYLEELIFPSGRISVYLFFVPLSVMDKKKEAWAFPEPLWLSWTNGELIKEIIPEYVPAKLHSYN